MDPEDRELRALLERARTIAIVGLSDRPERDSNVVARYLQARGYRIIPVNPNLAQVLEEPAYPALSAIPPTVTVDIVDIFRRSETVGPIVDEAIERRVALLWMQLGVENAPAAGLARAAGIPVVENRCLMQEHRRLGIGRSKPQG